MQAARWVQAFVGQRYATVVQGEVRVEGNAGGLWMTKSSECIPLCVGQCQSGEGGERPQSGSWCRGRKCSPHSGTPPNRTL